MVFRRAAALQEILRQRLCLLHPGRPQAVAHVAPDGRHLTDGIDGLVRGAQATVHLHAAPRAKLQAALTCQLVAGPHAAGHDDQICFQDVGRLSALFQELNARDLAILLHYTLDLHPAVHVNAQIHDFLAQDGARSFVQLRGHKVRRHLQHVALQLQVVDGLGRLQTQQAPADDHSALGARLHRGQQRLQVLDGTVHEDALGSARRVVWPVHVLLLRDGHARHRRHEAKGARGQDQHVVARRQCGLAARVRHLLGLAVDSHSPAVDELNLQVLQFFLANVRQLHLVMLLCVHVLEVLR